MMSIADTVVCDPPGIFCGEFEPPVVPEHVAGWPLHARTCPVCLVPHDREIHEATLSVKRWFRWKVTRNLYDEFFEVTP